MTGTPVRLFDTRTGPPLSPLTPRSSSAFGMGRLQAAAVLLNLTATSPSESTFVSATGIGPFSSVPTTSTINAKRGQTIANAAFLGTFIYFPEPTVTLGFYNDAGSVHLIADLVGLVTL